MLEIKDLIYITLITILFILYCKKNNQENMTNTGEIPNEEDIKDIIKEKINEIYQADIQAIRNLSTIAEKLQGGGEDGTGLVLPSDVIIRGNLIVDKDFTSKGSGNFGEKGIFGVNSGRPLVIQPSNHENEQTYLSFFDGHKRTGYILPHRNSKLDINGNVNINGPAIVRGNLYSHGESGNVLRANTNIQVESIKTNNIEASSIKTAKVNCSGDVNCQYLNTEVGAQFCKSSGRPVRVQSNNKYGETSWISFYKGKERCGYIVGDVDERKAKLFQEVKV